MAPTVVGEISRRDLEATGASSEALISDAKQLASYNWIEAPTPTIAVPGCPPLWSPSRQPRRIPKDSGLAYIDQNAARHPDSPLEPLFRALYLANPSFDICSVDVVTDRNSMRKLLSFVNPASNRSGLENFTISIEIVKDTVIFCRNETTAQEFIGPDEYKGYGRVFEKVFTKDAIKDSTGHHKIVSYRFGGRNFIVLNETDGYVGSDTRSSSSGVGNGLSGSLKSSSLASNDGPPIPAGLRSKLTVKKEGRVVPLDSTLEIKTRTHNKILTIEEAAAQLWVSQTPKLVRAYHKRGMFQVSRVEDVTVAMRRWEKDNQAHLRQLAALISKILGIVKGSGMDGNAVLRYDEKKDSLVVWRVDEKRMLPDDLYGKWGGKDDSRTDPIRLRPR